MSTTLQDNIMELNEYKKVYYNFEIACHQTRLIAISAGTALEDFPMNLPTDAKDAITAVISDLASKLTKAMASTSDDPSERKIKPMIPESSLGQKYASPVLQLFIAQSLSNQKVGTLNVESLLYAQELVMLLAHLDALMSDSLRAMCWREPRILHGSKKVAWGTILDCGSWENIIERLIEEYCFEFGWLSVLDRIKFLKSEHGLDINTSPDELNEIGIAEKLRHIIIHNGGRVSQEYLDRTRRTDVKVGDVIPVSPNYTEKIYGIIRLLGSDVYSAIARKFFQVKAEELTGILRRGRAAPHEA
jgi:hypothetical protein